MRPVAPSMLRRAVAWDYRSPGTYMLTLPLADRSRPWLGQVVGEGDAAHLEPSPLGRCVQAQWQALAEAWPGVEPRDLQLMPEHLHGILRVNTRQTHPLGQIVGSFKARCTAEARALASTAGGAASGGHPPISPWGSPTAAPPIVPASLLAGGSLWAPGFHDAILWTRARYRTERAYLLDNPRRLALKRANPDLFRVQRQLAVPLSTGEVAHFTALGNRFLLQRPLVQVQVSRQDFAFRRDSQGHLRKHADGTRAVAFTSPRFTQRRAQWLQAASTGSVLISPCVSDGERQIAAEALNAGLALVTLHNCGFRALAKPGGRAFEACCAGRLLLLAPAAWPSQSATKPLTREEAVALNRVAQWLAAEGAAEVNYHGRLPREIDTLARAAVLANTEEQG